MLIIAEGIDGSGKSTLISQLAEELPEAVLLHRGPLKQHPMLEYEFPFANYVPGAETSLLCDRWHVGELIYGPLYRGASQLTTAMRMHVDMLLLRLGAVKVAMDVPFETIQDRLSTRGEDFLQIQHRRLVYDAYQEQTAGAGWFHWKPPSRRREGEQLAALIQLAQTVELRAIPLIPFKTYVGPPSPKVLLLGDRRGPRRSDRPDYPWAFVPYRDTSGHFLLSALDAVGITSYDVGVANANEENLPALVKTLGDPKVITLGQNARIAAEKSQLDQALCVEHPQYVRRFQNASMHEYGAMIAKVLDNG